MMIWARMTKAGTVVLLAASSTIVSCGGGSPGSPSGDFSLSLSSSAVSSQVGLTTEPVTLAIDAQEPFADTVNIALQGLPQGMGVSPSSSFSLVPGASQAITFIIPASAAVGTTQITVSATGGGRSHAAQIALTAEPIVTTYQSGTRLYLESGTASDTSRVGLETTWGGSIVEVSVNGTEYVNRHDTGREVQPAFRTSSDDNWNPTLAGDGYDHGTPVIEQAVTATSIYIQAQPLQWAPDFYGGGPNQPVAGDVLVEQTLTAVPSSAHTFKLHYKVTHLGNDLHSTAGQEFPAVDTDRDYSHFVYYNGSAPWTNAALAQIQFPDLGLPNPPVIAPERWGALVDAQGKGLSVYAPSSGPLYIGFIANDPQSGGGPDDNSCNYFAAMLNWTLSPGLTQEADFYLMAGDYHDARTIINNLHAQQSVTDITAPYDNVDTPAPGATLSGTVSVGGWAFDDTSVSKVEIVMDGVTESIAEYGSPRPDVAQAYPNFAPVNVGFNYSLVTTKFSNGEHILNVRVTDTSGNVAIAPDIPVTVAN